MSGRIASLAALSAPLAAAALGLLSAALPAAASGHRAKKHLLVVTVTKGFRHSDSIAAAEKILPMLGEKSGGWDTDFVRTDEEMKEKMTPQALARYDGVCFANTTGELPLPDPQGFLDYIKAGHGFVAVHSGGDTFHKWPGSTSPVSEYIQMLGGEFRGHNRQCAVEARIEDSAHPALKPLARMASAGASDGDVRKQSVVTAATWKIFDEIYLFKNNERTNVHVLLSMDRHPDDGSKEANEPGDYLLAWSRPYGAGRVFYTALGHRREVWEDPIYQAHLTGGIEYALGLAKGSSKLSAPRPTSTRPVEK